MGIDGCIVILVLDDDRLPVILQEGGEDNRPARSRLHGGLLAGSDTDAVEVHPVWLNAEPGNHLSPDRPYETILIELDNLRFLSAFLFFHRLAGYFIAFRLPGNLWCNPIPVFFPGRGGAILRLRIDRRFFAALCRLAHRFLFRGFFSWNGRGG